MWLSVMLAMKGRPFWGWIEGVAGNVESAGNQTGQKNKKKGIRSDLENEKQLSRYFFFTISQDSLFDRKRQSKKHWNMAVCGGGQKTSMYNERRAFSMEEILTDNSST